MAKVTTSTNFCAGIAETSNPNQTIDFSSTGFLGKYELKIKGFGGPYVRDLQVCRGWPGILSFAL
jgi:hypothetical protein